MSEQAITTIKGLLPRSFIPFARDVYYRTNSVRAFWRTYLAGIAYVASRRKYYETQGFKYYLPAANLLVKGKCFRDQHEVNTRAMVRKHIAPEATVLDLGACSGIVSCVINRKLTHAGNHVAVEANPGVIDSLRTNRDLNACQFAIEHCILSRRSSGEFYVADDIFLSSSVAGKGKKVAVSVFTVEDLEAKWGLSFDTVFMDIQGSEDEFIRDNPGFLRRCKTVIVEMHDMIVSLDPGRLLLEKAGLKMIDTQGRVEVWVRPETLRHETQ